jgi:hypothetical protein
MLLNPKKKPNSKATKVSEDKAAGSSLDQLPLDMGTTLPSMLSISNPTVWNTLNLLSNYFVASPKNVEHRGPTTYLTINRYKESYTVTASYIPSEPPFPPSFPTGFMTIDEEFVKDALINKFENSFKNSVDYEVLGSVLYNYFIPVQIRKYIERFPPENIVILTQSEHDIPWEFTYDGKEFWCMKYNMGRALGAEGEIQESKITKSGEKIKIAVISNPEGNLPEKKERKLNSL